MTDNIPTFTHLKDSGWDSLTFSSKLHIVSLEHLGSIYPGGWTIENLELLTDNLMGAGADYLYADGLVTVSFLVPYYLESFPITYERAESPSDSVEIHWTGQGVEFLVNLASQNLVGRLLLSNSELVRLIVTMSTDGVEKNRRDRRRRRARQQ
jgi:hypothetical protein